MDENCFDCFFFRGRGNVLNFPHSDLVSIVLTVIPCTVLGKSFRELNVLSDFHVAVKLILHLLWCISSISKPLLKLS